VKYEKFILLKIVKEMVFTLGIKTVCEYPANSLMGNNSEVFDNLGCTVRRMKTFHGTNVKYDLVWSFCEFEKSGDPTKLIKDMLNLSGGYIFVVIQNNKNLGVHLHLLYHLLNGRKWDHGAVKLMSYSALMKTLTEFGLEILNYGWFDVPWFILDVYEMGHVIKRVISSKFVDASNLRETRFEKLPNDIKSWLSHHFYVLAKKRGHVKQN
jgi:hypothetical protein